MSSKFKVFLGVFFCIYTCNLVFCDINSSIISHVVHEVLDEFLLKEEVLRGFNILYDENTYHFYSEILSDLIPTGLYYVKILKFNETDRIQIMTRSAIFFLNSIYDFKVIDHNFIVSQTQPIKFFILIPKLSYEDLNASIVLDVYKALSVTSGEVFHFSYFITMEKDTLTLSTVEWYGPFACNRAYLKKLNTFLIKSMNWSSELKNYEKFLQYHGCELVMMLPIPNDDGTLYHVSGYVIVEKTQRSFEIHGLTPAIFDIVSKFYDFKTFYQPVSMKNFYWKSHQAQQEVNLITINGTYRNPQVYFEVLSLHSFHIDFVMPSSIVADLNVKVLVTPADKYTSFEKFFLPFDLQIWTYLSMSFAFAFLSTFIINRLSKSVQKLAHGKGNEISLWTIISIFCGISQTRLPKKNFSRFFLIFFIYFCFVFRICFQSKFFEFMTSEPRRPPPKTIEDLFDRNYKVYSMDVNAKLSGGDDRGMRWYVSS